MSWDDILLTLGLFGLFWWLAFFAVQPFSTVTQEEADEQTPGTPPSAPARFPFRRVAWQSTIAAALMTAIFVMLVRWEVIPAPN